MECPNIQAQTHAYTSTPTHTNNYTYHCLHSYVHHPAFTHQCNNTEILKIPWCRVTASAELLCCRATQRQQKERGRHRVLCDVMDRHSPIHLFRWQIDDITLRRDVSLRKSTRALLPRTKQPYGFIKSINQMQ